MNYPIVIIILIIALFVQARWNKIQKEDQEKQFNESQKKLIEKVKDLESTKAFVDDLVRKDTLIEEGYYLSIKKELNDSLSLWKDFSYCCVKVSLFNYAIADADKGYSFEICDYDTKSGQICAQCKTLPVWIYYSYRKYMRMTLVINESFVSDRDFFVEMLFKELMDAITYGNPDSDTAKQLDMDKFNRTIQTAKQVFIDNQPNSLVFDTITRTEREDGEIWMRQYSFQIDSDYINHDQQNYYRFGWKQLPMEILNPYS